MVQVVLHEPEPVELTAVNYNALIVGFGYFFSRDMQTLLLSSMR
jgi:hypothetical protein